MNVLFVHQNFPAQFRHLAAALAASGKNRVVFITQNERQLIPGVETVHYRPAPSNGNAVPRYLRDAATHMLNAQAVAGIARRLKSSGFIPDVMVGHNGWGEIWFLKDEFPRSPLLGYFEFFYSMATSDFGFDPSLRRPKDASSRIRTMNVGNLLGLDAADHGLCPTQWQKSVYPAKHHAMLDVIHDGIDTGVAVPRRGVRVRAGKGEGSIVLGAGDEVLTYVARNLEPFRGFPSFMRSLPAVLERRPNAHVLIVGGDGVSYGQQLPPGQNHRSMMLQELGSTLDTRRVHFMGNLPYAAYLEVLQISRVHVYLSYPFVLSWSMLEAMSCGCLVLGSRTPPVQEVIVDGMNGRLVDFFDINAISQKITESLEHVRAFDGLRVAARQTVRERYDLRQISLPGQLRLLERLASPGSHF